MEFFKPDAQYDFMRYRKVAFVASGLLVLASLVAMVYPGLNYGVDFRGGTELQLRFRGAVPAEELRRTLQGLGYSRPDVVNVQNSKREYIVRVQEVSALSAARLQRIKQTLAAQLAANPGLAITHRDLKVSPGGDKLSLRLSAPLEPVELQAMLERAGAKPRLAQRIGNVGDYRYEVQLRGIADDMVTQLQRKLGSRGPEAPRRVEWVGPKAGMQLRNDAIKALLFTIAMILVYVAFRFDLRFAPGGIIALLHDAIVTLGILAMFGREITLTTVAAILTIIGYSINDTIVIYDRIRENMARLRHRSLRDIINLSTSQTLSRTIITSGTAEISVCAFFIWGSPAIQDLALTLFIGMIAGTYSTIYIAAPITEWMDSRLFRKPRKK